MQIKRFQKGKSTSFSRFVKKVVCLNQLSELLKNGILLPYAMFSANRIQDWDKPDSTGYKLATFFY